jgi:hypothetical protein
MLLGSYYPQNESRDFITDGERTPTSHTGRPGQARFKERVLAWAHSVYVDLLAYLHQNKKADENANKRPGSRSRNHIYPRPPRQPSWNADMASAKSGDDSRNGLYSTYSAFGPSDGSFMNPYARQQLVREPGPPPIVHAKAALEMVENLCEESNWSWIDGMLLGGCLAYGLGDFVKALEWYKKIVSIDPRLVQYSFQVRILAENGFYIEDKQMSSRRQNTLVYFTKFKHFPTEYPLCNISWKTMLTHMRVALSHPAYCIMIFIWMNEI